MPATPSGLSEVAQLLGPRPPFDALSPAELDGLIADLEIEFNAAGTAIAGKDDAPVLHAIHSGAVNLAHDGGVDQLGPGDTFAHGPRLRATAEQDTLCYRIGAVPIERGWVLLGKALYSLVRTSRPSDSDALLAHKLRPEDLEDAPTIDEAFELLLGALSGHHPVFHTGAIERSSSGRCSRGAEPSSPTPRTPRCSAACGCFAAATPRRLDCR